MVLRSDSDQMCDQAPGGHASCASEFTASFDPSVRELRAQSHNSSSATKGSAGSTNLSKVPLKGDTAKARKKKGNPTIVPIRQKMANGAR
jgi:hypothetical protein